MNRSVLLIATALLGGCNMHSRNPADADGNVSIKADDSGHIAFNLPIVEGQLKVPASFMHHGNFDIDGVKLMPGSSITGFNVDAHNEGSTVNFSFTAPQSPDEVRSYFVDQFKKHGAEAALAGDAVSGKTKDGSAFT